MPAGPSGRPFSSPSEILTGSHPRAEWRSGNARCEVPKADLQRDRRGQGWAITRLASEDVKTLRQRFTSLDISIVYCYQDPEVSAKSCTFKQNAGRHILQFKCHTGSFPEQAAPYLKGIAPPFSSPSTPVVFTKNGVFFGAKEGETRKLTQNLA